jgi:NADH dehydrogenase
MSKNNLVIVGGGFGGIKLALLMADDKRFRVTLVTKRPTFRYYPTLYRTATGGKRMISSIPLEEIFREKKINIIQDVVTYIDRTKHEITTRVGHTIGYHTIVFAMGVETNYFGIKGLKDLSFNIKTTTGAEELKKHIHEQLIEKQKPDLNYVVIGGGPTGVELAGALPFYIKEVIKKHGLKDTRFHVDLIEAAPRLLPRMPKDISWQVKRRFKRIGVKLYLGTAVQAQTADALMLHDKAIRSHTVIWTAGVMNNRFFEKNKFQLTPQGKVRVNHYLQSEPGVFVIGDNADTPYSGMAQTALHDASYVAYYLKSMANQEQPNPYYAKKPIYVFPAGPNWAAVLWGKFRIYGRLGSILRSLADLVAYHDFEPWHLATKRWMAIDEDEDNCGICDPH